MTSFYAWALVIWLNGVAEPVRIVYDTQAHCEDGRAHIVDVSRYKAVCESTVIIPQVGEAAK